MAQGSPSFGPARRDAAAEEPRAGDTSLGKLTDFLAQHGAGSTSTDLALDLLLNEIVTQACQNTGATGAAVAMERDSRFVCRATTGINAPDLGSELNVSSGLSGKCAQSRQPQRCDDASIDTRVDARACWHLGVQSILMVPVLRGEKVLGVFEVFSPLANAFSERHEQILTGLSRRITGSLEDRSAHKANLADERDSTVLLDDTKRAAAPAVFTGGQLTNRTIVRDYLTPLLTVLVVGLALLLGWMLGRTGWLRAGKRELPPPPVVAEKPLAAEPPPIVALPSGTAPAASPVAPRNPQQPTGGLTVYERGKVVFEMKPSPRASRGVELAASTSKGEIKAVKLDPEVAAGYLVERVEPQYPDQARQQHIQGPVVLQALIGQDGAVQKLTALAGDDQLARAAAEAVRQWRFRPYAPQGRAVDFETQITVNFALP